MKKSLTAAFLSLAAVIGGVQVVSAPASTTPRVLVWSQEDVVFPGAASDTYRVMPWNQATSGIPAGSRIKVRCEVREHGLGSVMVRMFDITDPTAVGPSANAMRDLDRNHANLDSITAVDALGWAVPGGVDLWREMGIINEHKSPEFVIDQDLSNTRLIGIEVQCLDPNPVVYTIEIYATIE